MNFNEQMTEKVAVIEEILKAYMPKEEGPQKLIMEAMNYSVTVGGKRLRPMLMQETYRLFGGEGDAVEPFMAAQEMIHTYSLVHDDLPAMDNDEYRRGKKTTWVAYGEDMAILAGDGLLNYAFETALKAFGKADAMKVAECLKILAGKAGIYGMIGGQVQDLALEGKTATLEELQEMVGLKTGALLRAACEGGALLAGAGEEQLQAARNYADCIGLAFQIQDDILDVTGDQAVLGKAIGSDANNQKTTFVSVYGLETCRGMVRNLTQQALAASDVFADGEFLKELALYLAQRNH